MTNYPMKSIALAICACTIISCKSTELVYLNVKQPAPVTLPAYIKNIGVVNRTGAPAQNKVIDAVDKVFTLEGANLDKEGALASIDGLADMLVKDQVFAGVYPFKDLVMTTPVNGTFPAPIPWDTIDRICRVNKLDGLFTLELFDTDSKMSYSTTPTSIKTPLGNVPALEHNANMLTTVKTGWRIYDPATRTVLDEYVAARNLSFSGKGINPVAAASALLDRKEAVKQAGSKAGEDYAARIVPYWVRVSRDYYVKGSDNFTMARRKAQTGNWTDAAALWEKETTNPSSSIAGRACYNMAIISEINGDLDKAIKWSQKAYEDYNNHLALQYLNILKNRQAKQALLKEQGATD
ncbi:DUF6340 family protein [Chitinophaga agrisoli]|nr:DUF6340 family protein [Chitinophaga agrisoli]